MPFARVRRSLFTLGLLLLSSPALAEPIVGPNDVVAIFGDSNTEYGAFPKALERGLGVPVINAGHSGETALSAYWKYFDDLLATQRFSVLFVLFGLNDIGWGADTRPELIAQYRAYFLEGARLIAMKAVEKGVRVYFLSYPPTEDAVRSDDPASAFTQRVGELSRSLDSPFVEWYREAVKETAAFGVLGIDLYTPMWIEQQRIRTQSGTGIPQLHASDGGHLNGLGNELLARILLRAVAEGTRK